MTTHDMVVRHAPVSTREAIDQWVAGDTACFVELSAELQNEIIARTSFEEA
jgi:hypothetical protein